MDTVQGYEMDDVKRTMQLAATLIGDDGEYLYSEWELDQVASKADPAAPPSGDAERDSQST
jgi:hypothetical protein